MHPCGRPAIGFVGVFCRFKISEVVYLTVEKYSCSVQSALFGHRNPFESSGVIGSLASIVLILRLTSRSNILPLVVKLVSVFVVYLLLRPFFRFDQKRQTVGKIPSPLDTNKNPILRFVPSYSAGSSTWSTAHAPVKQTRLWHITQNRFYECCRQVVAKFQSTWFCFVSHSTLPRSVWSEAVQSACNALLPRLFST